MKFCSQLKTSEPSESCSSACSRHQMVCERSYFAHINTATQFRTAGLSCVRHREIDPWKEYRAFQEIKGEYERFKTPCHAPSYTTSSQSCFTQLDLLLFSCACTPPSDVVRLCPCRKYKKEQIALTDEWESDIRRVLSTPKLTSESWSYPAVTETTYCSATVKRPSAGCLCLPITWSNIYFMFY